MRSHSTLLKKRTFWYFLLLCLISGILYHQGRVYFRSPQAVLVLGGAPERERFAAHFAQEHPNLPVWVSSGSNPEYSEFVFSEAGIDLDRIYLNYEAEDTVTNFTTLIDDFKQQGITSVYLITSDYHMRRARVIAEIILGSQDIAFRPIAVPTEQPTEPLDKVLRDGARSVLWVTTGRTGSSLGRRLMGNRYELPKPPK